MSDTHTHPAGHAPAQNDPTPGYYEILEISVRELLTEKQLISAEEFREHIERLDSRSPALGAAMVARAWVDPEFRQRLLASGVKGALEFGIDQYDYTDFVVLEDTEKVHNVICCTLCSCYPRAVLGLPPAWYKSGPYRSRVIREPRAVLAEFGTKIPDDVEIRVSDSTANLRYMVLPMRPKGTENFTEEQLKNLVTRDCMIGVCLPKVS
jgi:thiocyanate hydrolase subunit gamma